MAKRCPKGEKYVAGYCRKIGRKVSAKGGKTMARKKCPKGKVWRKGVPGLRKGSCVKKPRRRR
jgi:hypothetical protein